MRNRFALLWLWLFIFSGCGEGYLEDFPVPPASTVPDFTFSLANEGFAPAEASFSNASIIPEEAGSYSLQWIFGDGSNSKEENPSHTYQAAGKYEVKLIITTERGIEQAAKTITVKNPVASGRRLYFGDRNTESVQLAIIGEEAPINVPLPGDPVNRPYGLAVDTINKYVYIADFANGVIFRSDPEGNNRTVFREGLAGPTGLALDLNTSNLFWATDDGVQKANLDDENTDQFETLISGISDDPEGLTLNPAAQKVYFVTYDGGLYRMNYDGSGTTELIPDVLGAAALVVDDKLYFHTYDLDASLHNLKMADLEGNILSTISSGMDGDVYGLAHDPEQNKLYWSDQRSGAIKRADLDGTGLETFFEDNTTRIYAIAVGGRTE
ncbi:MAG: PKD domain-containing protein [Candidatus Cyclobacteriaceae bacterium M3_2C_046]